MNKVTRTLNLLRTLRAGFSQVTNPNVTAPARRERLQFSKHRLVDFGELPHGEIPEALRAVRPSSFHKLGNQVRVVSESWIGGQPSISVILKAGSRQETLSNSSVANFAAHGALNGTEKYSKNKIDELVDSFGGKLSIKVEREITEFTLTFDSQFQTQAVELLAQIVLKPTYDAVEHEALKASISARANSMDAETVSIEAVHYTAFRDHYLGQPASGNKDVVYSITPQQVKKFHHECYVGKNIVISGAGAIDAVALTTESGIHFGNVEAFTTSEVTNSDQSFFTPSLLFQRDDEMLNTCFSVAFQAPTWSDPDFFGMNYFKRIIGEYQINKFNGEHLNSPHLQYNTFHTWIAGFPDIIMHKPFYFAYSDTALFGNFIYGNEMFTPEMSTVPQNQMSTYAQFINQSEVFRARNKYFNDLLSKTNSAEVASENGREAAYLDRVINRTEVATRISHMTPDYLTKLAGKWFWDKETAVTGYGNLHSAMANAHYNRTFKRATLGEYSQTMVHFQY